MANMPINYLGQGFLMGSMTRSPLLNLTTGYIYKDEYELINMIIKIIKSYLISSFMFLQVSFSPLQLFMAI